MKFDYKDSVEYDEIIAREQAKGLFLVGDEIIDEEVNGKKEKVKRLIFDVKPRPSQPKTLQAQITELLARVELLEGV